MTDRDKLVLFAAACYHALLTDESATAKDNPDLTEARAGTDNSRAQRGRWREFCSTRNRPRAADSGL